MRDQLVAGLSALGISLDPSIQDSLLQYRALVEASPIGLTGLKDPVDQLRELVVDSLGAASVLPSGLIVDLGTGGGVPGIPLALARPDTHWVLIESNQRKAGFVRSVLEPLGLSSRVTVLSERAETLGQDPRYRGQAQACVAKALALLPVLIELGLPFLERGGVLYAFKGPAAPEEEAASKLALFELKGALEDRLSYELEGRTRYLCRVRKTAPTPKKYPRRPGIPAHEPLG